ncbi:hypothetical protein WJX73_002411 [Symbiochloris irregularis]|uniref:Major facilitator superfamily (MFS) profile domain-containing protein n=1 Tax=Symbiochloris irregularis TaxID=706552 RepID=A0AAW1PBC7_9CHLO
MTSESRFPASTVRQHYQTALSAACSAAAAGPLLQDVEGGQARRELGLSEDLGTIVYRATLHRLPTESSAEGSQLSISVDSEAEAKDQSGGPLPPEGKGMSHRWRVNMSVAVIPMANELGWSAADRGIASSAFFWGYSATQIPAGILSTRIGGAKVLMAGVMLWSLGTLVAPAAGHHSLLALCITRAVVGFGEGLAPSSATSVIARLIPEGERSRAVTTVFGALDVGSAVGLMLCPPLIANFGWPSVFWIFAALGLFWSAFWPRLRPDEPDPRLAPPPPPSGKPDVPWGLFLRSRPVWAIIVAHFCFNWGYYTLLAWLPSYFELALGLNVGKSSFLTLVPYVAMSLMTPLVGQVADKLVTQGWAIGRVRKLAQGIAFAGPAVCLALCSYLTPAGASHTTSPASSVITIIVALLSISFALSSWARAGLYCNHQDLSPKYAGAMLGLSNTAGAIPGVLGVTSVGFLLDITSSWGYSLFYPCAAFYVVGLVIYSALASSERQGWDD